MALQSCPTCHNANPSQATVCLHCGMTLEGSATGGGLGGGDKMFHWIGLLIAILVLGMMAFEVAKSSPDDEDDDGYYRGGGATPVFVGGAHDSRSSRSGSRGSRWGSSGGFGRGK